MATDTSLPGEELDRKDTGSLMDDPQVAADRDHTAMDYSEAAGQIITDLPVAGPGDMPIEGHVDTFQGFMSISRYGGAAVALVVFWSTILFAMGGAPWLTALSTLGLGLVFGAALKLRGWYYPVLVVSTLILGLGAALAGGGPDVPEPGEVEVDESPL